MTLPNKDVELFFLNLVNENKLKVNRDGTVINNKTGNILGKNPNSKDGYHSIGWKINKKVFHILTHRLVFLVYGGIFTDEKPFVNHKDGNKSNNHIDNLEAVSNKENSLHAWANGLTTWTEDKKTALIMTIRGTNSSSAKLTENDVVKLISLHRSTNMSRRKLGEIFNLSSTTITRILNKKTYKDVWEKIDNGDIII